MVDMLIDATNSSWHYHCMLIFLLLGHNFHRGEDKATKEWVADIGGYSSSKVPLSVECQRVLGHECSVATFGTDGWSGSQATQKQLIGWEAVMIRRLFTYRKESGGTVAHIYIYILRTRSPNAFVYRHCCGENLEGSHVGKSHRGFRNFTEP